MDDLDDFYIHKATVETYLGAGAYGDLFAAPVVLDPDTATGCFIEGKRKLVRNAAGEQVISETTLYTSTAHAALFTTDSKVTTDTITSRVITVNTNDSGPLDLPDHVAVNLQ